VTAARNDPSPCRTVKGYVYKTPGSARPVDVVWLISRCQYRWESLMDCSGCGISNAPDHEYCVNCGSRLAVTRCRKCGYGNDLDFTFCQQCGARLGRGTRRALVIVTAIVVLVFGAAAGSLALGMWDGSPPETVAGETTEPNGIGDEPGVAQPAAGAPMLAMNVAAGDPVHGLVSEDNDGRIFMTANGVWAVFEPDGSSYRTGGIVAGWFVAGSEGSEFHPNPDAPAYALEWVDQTLGSLAGVTDESGQWIISDPVTLLQQTLADGVFVPDGETVELLYTAPGEYVYFDVADDHAWLIDETAAVMVLETDNGLEVGGWAEVEDGGVVFHYSNESDQLNEKAHDVLASSLVDEVQINSDDPPGSDTILLSGSALSEADMSQIKFFFSCGWCKKAANKTNGSVIQPIRRKSGDLLDAGGDLVEEGANKTVDLGEASLDGLKTGYVYAEKGAVATAKATKQVVVATVNGVIRLIDLLAEHSCPSSDNPALWWKELLFTGSSGPGKGSDGTGTPDHPRPGYFVAPEKSELLQLARVWMPAVQLSKDEKCGEIVKIVAKVFPYADDGSLITTPPYLREAALVEVVYTLMFRYDGGRFCNLPGLLLGNPFFTPDLGNLKITLPDLTGIGIDFEGIHASPCGFHPGDNEGFSIALKRATHSGGGCSLTGFELIGGRTAAHTGGSVKTDIHPADVPGFPCPSSPSGARGPSGEGFVLWVSESKHGTYWDEAECDGELGGLEECEGGRGSYNLASRVELWEGDPGGDCGSELTLEEDGDWPPEYYRNGGPDTYLNHEGRMKPFECLARGKPGPAKDNYRIDVTVPDVTGLGIDLARATLLEHGLTLASQITDVPLPVDSSDDGRVVSHTPMPGDQVPFGTSVAVSVGQTQEAPSPDPSPSPSPSNRPPVAVNNRFTLNPEDVGVLTSLDLVANDSDPDGDALELTRVTCVQSCNALDLSQFFADGWIEIVVDPSYPDSYAKIVLEYEVSDGAASDTATVTIEVFFV